MEEGRGQVAAPDRLGRRVSPVLVAGADHLPAANAGAGERHAEDVSPVVTPTLFVDAWRAPELGTAADAITSRLYWSIGYNTPCNRVGRVRVSDLHLSRSAYYLDEVGAHSHL